jgi:type IV pilus assembly protein PilX
MKQKLVFRSARQQRGAVLIVSMLLLLVVTVLALGASQSTRLQERMASSQRNYDLAFQSAEAALRAGERMLDNPAMAAPPLPCSTPPCQVYERGYLNNIISYENQAYEPRSWWTTNARSYGATEADNLIAGSEGQGLARRDPQYYVEEIEEVPDALSIPPTGPPPSRIYYRIIARGEGGTANTSAVLHSTYARRFN